MILTGKESVYYILCGVVCQKSYGGKGRQLFIYTIHYAEKISIKNTWQLEHHSTTITCKDTFWIKKWPSGPVQHQVDVDLGSVISLTISIARKGLVRSTQKMLVVRLVLLIGLMASTNLVESSCRNRTRESVRSSKS